MASSRSNALRRRVTEAELARELGVSRQAVNKHVKAGNIEKGQDGKIDFDLACMALADRVRPSGKTVEAITTPAPPPAQFIPATQPTQTPTEPAEPDPEAATSYHVARTLRETEMARLAKLERLEKEGKLTDAADAARAVWTAFRTLRDTVMPLGRRVASKAAHMTDPREIQIMVDAEVRAVLLSFRDKLLAPIAADIAQPGVPADAAIDPAPVEPA